MITLFMKIVNALLLSLFFILSCILLPYTEECHLEKVDNKNGAVSIIFKINPSLKRSHPKRETVIENSTIWSEEEGPYVLNEDITIAPGANLTIEAGTIVTLGESVNITIKGNLFIKGKKGNEAIFRRSASDLPWGSIIIDASGFAHMRNVEISGATRSIICNNTSPILENLTISDATTGLIFIGRCAPLVRNTTIKEVMNGIGLQGVGIDRSRIPLTPTSSGETTFETTMHVSEEELNERIKGGDCRLVFYAREPALYSGGLEVLINGVTQNFPWPPAFGKYYSEGYQTTELGFERSVQETHYFDPYFEDLIKNISNPSQDPLLLANLLPTECHFRIKDGFVEGMNTIQVILEKTTFPMDLLSVFIEFDSPTRGIFDNITITHGEDWGIYLSDSSSIFSRLRVQHVSRHIVIKGASHPFIAGSSFDGRNAVKGIISTGKGAFIRLIGSTFHNFDTSPIEISQGLAVIVLCDFFNISTSDLAAVHLDPNPLLLPEIASAMEITPIVIYGCHMEKVSGWGLRIAEGGIFISNSTFKDCDNVLYLGEGVKGEIFGNRIEDPTGIGILVYRGLDNHLKITSNYIVGPGKYGIIVKETELRISNNTFERSKDTIGDINHLTPTYLLRKNWALFMENSRGYIDGNTFSDNNYSIMIGVDSAPILNDNTIIGDEGIGIGMISQKKLYIYDTVIAINAGYDLVCYGDSDISIDENGHYEKIKYLEEEGTTENGGRMTILLVATLAALLLFSFFYIKMKKEQF